MTVTVQNVDNGNAGVTLTYNTTWTALSGDKLPLTTTANEYNSGTYARNADGGMIVNLALMNRSATSTINASKETVPEWNIMDLDQTDPWDLAYQYSPGGVRVLKAKDATFLNWQVSSYSNGSSGMLLAYRIKVSNKGDYTLSIKSIGIEYGVVPEVFVFEDDGTYENIADIRQKISSSDNGKIGYHNFSVVSDAYQSVGHFNAAERGEYFVVFCITDKDAALARNSTVKTSPEKEYQEMYLQSIQLTEYVAPPAPVIKYVSTTLDGVIGVNVKVENIPQDGEGQYTVKFTVGEDAPQVLSAKKKEGDLWVFTGKLYASRMMDALKVQLYKGEEMLGEKSFTVADYVAGVSDLSTTTQEEKNLLAAMLNYGKYAAAYKNNYTGELPTLGTPEFTNFGATVTQRYEGVSVSTSLDDACNLLIKFPADFEGQLLVDNADKGQVSALPIASGKKVYTISAIAAQNWDTKHTFVVDGKVNMELSVMDYIKGHLSSANAGTDGKMDNLMKAMYFFNQAANALEN